MGGGEGAGKLSFHFSTVGVYAGSLRAGNPLHHTQVMAYSRCPENFHNWVEGKELGNVNARLFPYTQTLAG